jgi:hypothetical protein
VPEDCDDKDPCTVDACTPTGFCDNILLDESCSGIPCATKADCFDGDPCTDETCEDPGYCLFAGTPGCGPCEHDADCTDEDSCTDDICSSGECVHPAIPGCKPCDQDGDCNHPDPCVEDMCMPFGLCNTTATVGCTGTPCATDADCGESFCQVGTCSPKGACIVEDNPFCTNCHEPNFCFDEDPCTKDQCTDEVCGHTPIANCQFTSCVTAAGCDDGDACTVNTCKNGRCDYWKDPACIGQSCGSDEDCPSAEACTAAFCNPEKVCTAVPMENCATSIACTTSAGCDDGDSCTIDSCVAGTCQHLFIEACQAACQGPADCTPDNVCEYRFCSPDGSCIGGFIQQCAPDPEGCGGSSCEDADPCTLDYCSSGGFCEHEPVAFCGGKACTLNAECEDGNPCTLDVCGPTYRCGVLANLCP